MAYSLGLEDGGVMAGAKHVPGHGDTSTDSHKSRTVVTHTQQQLDSVDLVPFEAFVNAGCVPERQLHCGCGRDGRCIGKCYGMSCG